ncbi:hypothetical protein [Caballeronia glebae]|uniref:hypothetical protein n=1 Tax=Caballeronia glebae TaxID=1777143 RepID=UPI0038BB4A84
MDVGNFKILTRNEFQSDFQHVVVATLGPAGTSSEYVGHRISRDVELFPTYEQAEACTHRQDREAVLLVANAYQYINRFYISTRTKPVAAFFCDTPSYVLASKAVRLEDIPSRPRISSHRAPAHLLEQIFPQPQFTFVEADSTSAAARMAAESVVDACITTKIACDREGLNTLYNSGTIPMLWTIFSRK